MSGQAKALRVVKKKINGFRSGVVAAAVVAVVVAVVVVALRIAWAVKNVIVKKKEKKNNRNPNDHTDGLFRGTYAGAKRVLVTGRGDMGKVLNDFLCVLRLAGAALAAERSKVAK